MGARQPHGQAGAAELGKLTRLCRQSPGVAGLFGVSPGEGTLDQTLQVESRALGVPSGRLLDARGLG